MEPIDYRARVVQVTLRVSGENRDVLIQLNVLRYLLSIWKNMALDLYLTLYTKMNSKYINT